MDYFHAAFWLFLELDSWQDLSLYGRAAQTVWEISFRVNYYFNCLGIWHIRILIVMGNLQHWSSMAADGTNISLLVWKKKSPGTKTQFSLAHTLRRSPIIKEKQTWAKLIFNFHLRKHAPYEQGHRYACALWPLWETQCIISVCSSISLIHCAPAEETFST